MYDKLIEKIKGMSTNKITESDAGMMKIEMAIGKTRTFEKVINALLEIAIREAKKEVFDDIYSYLNSKNHNPERDTFYFSGRFKDLDIIKKRHLSPSAEGALNSRTIQSAKCTNPKCICHNPEHSTRIDLCCQYCKAD